MADSPFPFGLARAARRLLHELLVRFITWSPKTLPAFKIETEARRQFFSACESKSACAVNQRVAALNRDVDLAMARGATHSCSGEEQIFGGERFRPTDKRRFFLLINTGIESVTPKQSVSGSCVSPQGCMPTAAAGFLGNAPVVPDPTPDRQNPGLTGGRAGRRRFEPMPTIIQQFQYRIWRNTNETIATSPGNSLSLLLPHDRRGLKP